MKILVLGDVVGRPGEIFSKTLNHSSNGKMWISARQWRKCRWCAGLTAKTAHELKSAGVDLLTLGDHVWDQKNFDNEIDDLDFVCRPANLPESTQEEIESYPLWANPELLSLPFSDVPSWGLRLHVLSRRLNICLMN